MIVHIYIVSSDVLMLGHRPQRWPNLKPSLDERVVFVGFKLISVSDLLLGHRLRRWPNINPSLNQRVVLAVFILIPVSVLVRDVSAMCPEDYQPFPPDGNQMDVCMLS